MTFDSQNVLHKYTPITPHFLEIYLYHFVLCFVCRNCSIYIYIHETILKELLLSNTNYIDSPSKGKVKLFYLLKPGFACLVFLYKLAVRHYLAKK